MNEIAPTREFTAEEMRMVAFIRAMKEYPQVECPLTHWFCGDIYVRQIFIPKGTLIISKVHLTRHSFLFSSGEMKVWATGEPVKMFCAPQSGMTIPNQMRIAIATTDCVWTTFHLVGKNRDIADIENDLGYDPCNFLSDDCEYDFQFSDLPIVKELIA